MTYPGAAPAPRRNPSPRRRFVYLQLLRAGLGIQHTQWTPRAISPNQQFRPRRIAQRMHANRQALASRCLFLDAKIKAHPLTFEIVVIDNAQRIAAPRLRPTLAPQLE